MNQKEFYKIAKNIKIETKNLILRPLRKTDAPSITKYLQEKVFSKNMPEIPFPYFLKDAENHISKKEHNLTKKTPTLEIALFHKQKKEVIGAVSLLNINFENNSAESGSWIGKPFWGSGLIHEAKIEFYKFVFQKLKLIRIFAEIYDYNPRSFKHLEKLGFKRQGVFRKNSRINNKYVNDYYYEMLKEEFDYKNLKKKFGC